MLEEFHCIHARAGERRRRRGESTPRPFFLADATMRAMSAHSLAPLVDALVASYRSDPRAHHINKHFLPSRDEAIEIVSLLLQVFYPGYFGRPDVSDEDITYHVGMLLSQVQSKLERQVELCLCYRGEDESGRADVPRCRGEARSIAWKFLEGVPALRALLVKTSRPPTTAIRRR